MLKKDKEKVLDEVWNEERVASFLDLEAPDGVNADYHTLLRAYQSMRVSDFSLFLEMFTAAGRDLNAKDEAGNTLLSLVREHRHGAEFAAALTQAGAA